MAKFSKEARETISRKAKEREARKRALRAAEDLRPDGDEVSAVTITAGGKSATLTPKAGTAEAIVDVLDHAMSRPGREAPPTAGSLSRQARAALAKIRAEVVEITSKLFQTSEQIRGYNEVLGAAIASRDAQIDLIASGAEVPETVEGIKELTTNKINISKRIAELKETRKELKARLALAYAAIDRAISGEDPSGSLFAGGGS